jgi:adenylyltransferase/sulfurtransferase
MKGLDMDSALETEDQGLDRYSRQIRFPQLGESGQRALLKSRVTLCGCGALGTVLANHLARAGVGMIRIIDRDFIEIHNLQRQILFDEADVAENLPKAEAAARKIRAINSTIQVEPVVTDLDHTNILELVRDADLILDGTDNFETRYLINDAAVKLGKPWIYGGVIGSEGQTMTIVPGHPSAVRVARRDHGLAHHLALRPQRRPGRGAAARAAQLRRAGPATGRPGGDPA